MKINLNSETASAGFKDNVISAIAESSVSETHGQKQMGLAGKMLIG